MLKTNLKWNIKLRIRRPVLQLPHVPYEVHKENFAC